MKQLSSTVLLSFVFAMMIAAPLAAAAEDVFCADVVPSCSSSGQPLEPFNQGECSEYYARQCAAQVANQMSDQLVACEQDGEQLQKRLKRLKKRVRRLRRKSVN